MHGFRCDNNWLQRLREAVKGKQVVGVSSFEGIVGAHVRHPGLEWRYEDVKGRQTPCQRSYVEVRAKGGEHKHGGIVRAGNWVGCLREGQGRQQLSAICVCWICTMDHAAPIPVSLPGTDSAAPPTP